MSGSFDVVLDRGHPQREPIQSVLDQIGGSLGSVETTGWTAAIAAGSAEWIVLLDRSAVVPSGELPNLQSRLDSAGSPVWLKAWTTSDAARRYVGEHCPPAIALCWNNPAEYSAVCVRRSLLSKLPAFDEVHVEPIWDWLIRIAARPIPFHSMTTALTNWFIGTDGDQNGLGSHSPSWSVPTLISPSPASEKSWLIEHILRTKPSQFVPEKCSEADAVAVKAGLLLWHDAAEASHQLSQSIEGLGKHHCGDYWHAILHRREPDYSNAKYWFRQLSPHPIFGGLIAHAARILDSMPVEPAWKTRLWGQGSWDPFAFVDLCAACASRDDTPLNLAARQIQAIEMQLLIAATYRDASGMKDAA